jgi:aspartate/methionine/tyrosine aminotransferase
MEIGGNRPNFNRIAQELAVRREKGEPIIDLSAANPVGILPTFAPELLVEASRRYFFKRRYEPDPHGLPSAREAIAEWYAIHHQIAVDTDRIIITASTSESYQLLIQCLFERGSSVLVPSPSYPLLEEFAAQRAVQTRAVPLRRYDQWRYSPLSFEGFLDPSVAGIVLVSPNNPTGTIASAQELKDLIQLLKPLPYRPPLIIDEVFAGALFGENRTCHGAALESDYPVILLNGISKSFCAPDLKVGWMVCNDAAWSRCGEGLLYANDLLLSCSGLSQYLMTQMMKGGGVEYLVSIKEALNIQYRMTMAVLGCYPWIKAVPPQGGWMVFAEIEASERLGKNCDEEELFVRAAREGVAIHPGHFYGVSGEGIFGAISLLTSPSVLEAGIALIDRVRLGLVR